MNIIKQLIILSKNKIPYEKAIKIGLNISELKSKGFIIIKTIKNKNYEIPKNVPKYAMRFAFTRKKYGINQSIIENKTLKITKKGIDYIKNSIKKTKEIEEIVEKPRQIEIEDEIQN